MKNRSKTTLLLMSVFLFLIFVISLIVYFFVSRHVQKDFNDLLELRAKSIVRWNIENGSGDQLEELSERLLHEKDYVFKFPLDYGVLEDSTGLPVRFLEEVVSSGKSFTFQGGYRFIGMVHEKQFGDDKYLILSGAEHYFERNLVLYLVKLFLYILVLSCVLALISSYILSRFLFKPIEVITNRVKRISSENLHLRLPEKGVSDELNELTLTFNDMLNRIETSFEIQNNFVSNASHELRTPLTSIIGEADLALSKTRSVEEYQDSLKVILEEAEHLDAKTKALLSLAQTGFNGKTQGMEMLRVDQLVFDTKEIVEKLDKRHRIVIDYSMLPENPKLLKVNANYQLLQLALSNILVNSSKYSSYKEVLVSIGSSDSFVYLIIRDSGIGIPKEELPYIYDPFFRASNTHSYEGFGIGLPLTRNIIDLHNGEIVVHSDVNEGTVVRINLPIF